MGILGDDCRRWHLVERACSVACGQVQDQPALKASTTRRWAEQKKLQWSMLLDEMLRYARIGDSHPWSIQQTRKKGLEQLSSMLELDKSSPTEKTLGQSWRRISCMRCRAMSSSGPLPRPKGMKEHVLLGLTRARAARLRKVMEVYSLGSCFQLGIIHRCSCTSFNQYRTHSTPPQAWLWPPMHSLWISALARLHQARQAHQTPAFCAPPLRSGEAVAVLLHS